MIKKFQSLTENKIFIRVMSFCMVLMCLASIFVINAFAVDGADMTPKEAATSIFSTVSQTINVGSIVGIIAIALGAGLGLYFAWWAIRKVIRMVKSGLNGKLKV